MTSSTSRFAAVLLGAVVLAATIGGQPARGQTVSCPCLTSQLVDGWFLKTLQSFETVRLSVDQRGRKLACVDEPGFTTFDYFDRPGLRSLLIDLTYATSRKPARCVVDPSHAVNRLTESRWELTNAQADACRREILSSWAWKLLGCPKN